MASLRWHVTSSENRASIEEHGLDWRQMGKAPGVAGTHGSPEVEGVFLCDSWWEVEYFAGMALSTGIESVDIWELRLGPTEVMENEGSGYRFLPQPISRERLRLVRQDWSPPSLFDEEETHEPEYVDWLSVMENKPDVSPGSPEWPHWYVHGSDGFEEMDPAVQWAMEHSDSVIIRPLTGDYYWAGRRPKKWNHDSRPLRAWPPPDDERRAIEANSTAVRRRLEAIDQFAPRLSTEIAARLSAVLPEPWSAISDQSAVVLLYERRESHRVDFKEFDPDVGLFELLNFVQDWISELTTVPWPHDPKRGLKMYAPSVELREGTLRACYGPATDPVLQIDPIEVDPLLP